MSMYIKKIDKYTIESAPRNLGNVANYNSPANEERLLADGWRRLVETPCPGWGYRATYAIRGEEVRQGWELLPLDNLKAEKAAQLAAAAERETREAEQGFISPELATRDMQATGARALQADPAANTPEAQFVKSIAATIGIPVEALCERILANVAPANTATAQIIGDQNRLETAAHAATTHEELAAIAWPEETTEEQ